MAYRRSIIQLKADCDPTDFILVKLHQTYIDGRTEKRKVPSTDSASIEEILYCLKEFLEAAATLNFDTGDECMISRARSRSRPALLRSHLSASKPGPLGDGLYYIL
jgi:hypothetical protein